MNEQLQTWQNKINALESRERILIMVTALVAVVMLLELLLIDPLLAQRKQASAELSSLKQQLQQEQNTKQIIAAEISAGVNRNKERRKQQLSEQVAQLDKQIQESVVAMIPPQMMPQVLEKILEQDKELKLISLENKAVVPVLEDKPDEDSPADRIKRAAHQKRDLQADDKQGLYRHGFILKLSGNYMAAIRYFQRLSQLPWHFYWDDLSYDVDGYPDATITLEVHTVSMSKEWIGV